MAVLPAWRRKAADLRTEIHALSLACKHPRVPWYAKLLLGAVVAYALSPIDLIPDFIPVLGHLDDLVLIPLGIALVRKMIPAHVLQSCREEARSAHVTPRSGWAVAAVVLLWLGAILWLARTCWHAARGPSTRW